MVKIPSSIIDHSQCEINALLEEEQLLHSQLVQASVLIEISLTHCFLSLPSGAC